MSLINCKECGKQISDKAKKCPHCGVENNLVTCPECKKMIESSLNVCPNCGYEIKKGQDKRKFSTGIVIWIIICIISCFGMAFLNFFVKTDINGLMIMPYLACLLGISYIILLVRKNKINLYILLGINVIIIIYNLLVIGIFVSILNIVCALINSIITLLAVKKSLNNDKLNLASILVYVISLIITIIGIFLNFNNISNKAIGSWIGDNNFEFDFYKDNKCHVKIPDLKVDPSMDDKVNILYSNCNYELVDNKLTLTFDYSITYLSTSVPMHQEFVLYYDEDNDSFSNENGKVTYHRK